MTAAPGGVRVAHPAQARTLVVLSLAQALGGVANGVALGVGALLVERVSGDAALSGLAATLITLGGAIVATPLARLAHARGRRVSLTIGALLGVAGSALLATGGALGVLALVLVGFLVLGGTTAVNLQSRFAATDLAAPAHRGRDLAIVVWMTTIGVVIGPNLLGPGDALGLALGLPALVGAYVICGVAQLLTAVVLWTLLRPDPLLTALAEHPDVESGRRPGLRLAQHPRALAGIVLVAASHATMVGIMALTPVHLAHHGGSLTIIGLTMSAHTAGMYVLSPLFGWLSDRVGRVPVVLVGQGVLVAAIAVGALAPVHLAPLALALLGLGWSAATVAGSTLIAESVAAPLRPRVQGRADAVLGLSGAAAGAAAGPILAALGYEGLNLVMLACVALASGAAIVVRRVR